MAVQNRYKFALICLRLQKCADAERALILKPSGDAFDEPQIACGAAGYYLLGMISEKQTR